MLVLVFFCVIFTPKFRSETYLNKILEPKARNQIEDIMSKRKNISQVFILYFSFIALASAIIIGIAWFTREIYLFREQTQMIRQQYIDSQKNIVRNEVNTAIKIIEDQQRNAEISLLNHIEQRSKEAYIIAEYIYKNNRASQSTDEIRRMILQALQPLNEKMKANYFIINNNGNAELLPENSVMQGKILNDFPDSIAQQINQIAYKKVAFINWFPYRLNNDTTFREKKAHLRYFAPLNWYIGYGSYTSTNIASLQENLLSRLQKITFGNDNYLFINTFDPTQLISNGSRVVPIKQSWTITDSVGIQIIESEIANANNSDGSFIYHHLYDSNAESKITFIKAYPEWKWLIGATISLANMEEIIESEYAGTLKSVKKQLILITIFLVAMLMVIFAMSVFLRKRMKKNFHIFARFFEKAVDASEKIDVSRLNFSEFQELALTANKMLDKNRQAKHKLEYERSRLRYLVDSIPDMIFFKNHEGRYLGCNKAFEAFIGKKEADIIGQTPEKLFDDGSGEFYGKMDEQVLTQRQPQEFETWLTFPNQQQRLFYVVKTLYYDKNKNVLGIIGLCHDITEFRENEIKLKSAKEKAEESDKLKSAFLANMSHEIRSPLNAIIGFSRLLLNPQVQEQQKNEYVEHIYNSGNSLLHLINDIIDIAKIEAGQIQVKKDECPVNKILNELKATYETQKIARNKPQIELRVIKAENDKDFTIFSDPFRLQQILANLIGNALKFTKEGYIEFGYSITGKRTIQFYVKDTGIGISKDKQAVIFERFGQATDQRIDNREGTGLGLAISKNLVELLGGEMWVESEIDQGSTFYFTLPYQRITQPLQKQDEQTAETIDWNGLSFLVAEDNTLNQRLINDTLKVYQQNITIEIVENGEKAIEVLKTKTFDLIIMDLRMPGLDGFETTKHIRNKLAEPQKNIPILGLSAHAMKEEKAHCLSVGMNEYLTKPFVPQDLYNKINQLVTKGQHKEKTEKTSLKAKKQAAQKKDQIDFFEFSLLKKIYQDNQEKISSILGICLVEIPQQVEQMQTDFDAKNWKAVADIAHSLRTSFHYLGLRELMPIAKLIEKNARTGGGDNKDFIAEMIAEIKTIWIDVSKKLESLR